jgi:hypothetical protein
MVGILGAMTFRRRRTLMNSIRTASVVEFRD